MHRRQVYLPLQQRLRPRRYRRHRMRPDSVDVRRRPVQRSEQRLLGLRHKQRMRRWMQPRLHGLHRQLGRDRLLQPPERHQQLWHTRQCLPGVLCVILGL
jgi:hypothetical protein